MALPNYAKLWLYYRSAEAADWLKCSNSRWRMAEELEMSPITETYGLSDFVELVRLVQNWYPD